MNKSKPPPLVVAARTDALRRAGKDRTARAVKAVEGDIRLLLKDGGQISFRSVARASGVSTKFLHQHPDLSARIRALRDQQRGRAEAAHESAAAGEIAIIAALRRQLREAEQRHRAEASALRARIKEQEHQISVLYGHLSQGRPS